MVVRKRLELPPKRDEFETRWINIFFVFYNPNMYNRLFSVLFRVIPIQGHLQVYPLFVYISNLHFELFVFNLGTFMKKYFDTITTKKGVRLEDVLRRMKNKNNVLKKNNTIIFKSRL